MVRTASCLRLLAIALAALLTASCSPPPAAEAGSTAVEETGVCSAAEPGKAPDCRLEDLDGHAVRLSDSAGRVTLVDFWATWCAPCREEIPMFKELHERYGDEGFTLLAISMDDGSGVVREFVDEYQIPYLNVMGNDDVADAFGGVFGLPTAFLLDGEGRIVDRFMGPKPRKVLEDKIRELLGLGSA